MPVSLWVTFLDCWSTDIVWRNQSMMLAIMKCETLYPAFNCQKIHLLLLITYIIGSCSCCSAGSLNQKTRPNLVQSLSQSLEAMAGYMDIGAFGGIVPNPSDAVTSNSRSGVSDVPVGHGGRAFPEQSEWISRRVHDGHYLWWDKGIRNSSWNIKLCDRAAFNY